MKIRNLMFFLPSKQAHTNICLCYYRYRIWTNKLTTKIFLQWNITSKSSKLAYINIFSLFINRNWAVYMVAGLCNKRSKKKNKYKRIRSRKQQRQTGNKFIDYPSSQHHCRCGWLAIAIVTLSLMPCFVQN